MAGHAVIAAGFGFRAGAGAESLADALARTGRRADVVATLAGKDEAPALRALSARLGVPVVAVPPDEIARQYTATRSTASLAAHGTGSVAEASALAAAGPGARLIGPRAISADRMATCALATGPGRPDGRTRQNTPPKEGA